MVLKSQRIFTRVELPILSVRGGPIFSIGPSCCPSFFQSSSSFAGPRTSVILASKFAVASVNFPAWQESRNCRACSFGSVWPSRARVRGTSRISGTIVSLGFMVVKRRRDRCLVDDLIFTWSRILEIQKQSVWKADRASASRLHPLRPGCPEDREPEGSLTRAGGRGRRRIFSSLQGQASRACPVVVDARGLRR